MPIKFYRSHTQTQVEKHRMAIDYLRLSISIWVTAFYDSLSAKAGSQK